MAFKSVSALACACLLTLALGGCGGGGGGDDAVTPSNTSDTSDTLRVTGTVDTSNLLLAYQASPFEQFLAFFSPVNKAYAVATTVNNIVAISPGTNSSTYIEATKHGNDFTLNLEKGKSYVIVLLNGTNIVGLYKADDGSDMDSLPIGETATDIDLGTITLNGGKVTGSIPSATLFQDLGITTEIAQAIGFMDDGMRRHANVDVDGNGVIDSKEGKWYDLQIGYQFRPSESFASILNTWSDKTKMLFTGYTYYVGFAPGDTYTEAVWRTAKLHSPVDINAGNDVQVCYFRDDRPEDNSVMLNFYCGSSATTPTTPCRGLRDHYHGSGRRSDLHLPEREIAADCGATQQHLYPGGQAHDGRWKDHFDRVAVVEAPERWNQLDPAQRERTASGSGRALRRPPVRDRRRDLERRHAGRGAQHVCQQCRIRRAARSEFRSQAVCRKLHGQIRLCLSHRMEFICAVREFPANN